MTTFTSPVRLVVARDCVDALATHARDAGVDVRRVLLVSDAGIAANSKVLERVERALAATATTTANDNASAAAAVVVERFVDVEVNPRATTVQRCAARALAVGATCVVGVGGGSVLDCAKAAAMLAAQPDDGDDDNNNNGGGGGDDDDDATGGNASNAAANAAPATTLPPLSRFVGRNRFRRTPLPFVAVPTTCGTGSEVTWVAVVTLDDERRKVSVKGDSMYARVALVDASLTATLPRRLVAATLFDALTHALEAFCSSRANIASDALAARAVALLVRHARAACSQLGEQSEAARAHVSAASTLAGLAFNSADVGAVHCLSESIGGLTDKAHGELNAALLVPTFKHHIERQVAAAAAAAAAEKDHESSSSSSSSSSSHVLVRRRLAELWLEHGVQDAVHRAEQGGAHHHEHQSVEACADSLLAAVSRLRSDLELPLFSALGVDVDLDERIATMAVDNGSNASNGGGALDRNDYLAILRLARNDVGSGK